MRTIWKYDIPVGDAVELRIPMDATILHVAAQNPDVIDVVQMWVEVDSEGDFSETRRFQVHGSGHRISESEQYVYVGTAIVASGQLVWHVYEQVLR